MTHSILERRFCDTGSSSSTPSGPRGRALLALAQFAHLIALLRHGRGAPLIPDRLRA